MSAVASGKTSSLALVEVLAFFGGVMLYIWWLQAVAPYTAAILFFAMLAMFRQRDETAGTLGLGFQHFHRVLKRWRFAWLFLMLTTVGLAWSRLGQTGVLSHALLYFLWCILQQLAYQGAVVARLRDAFHPAWKARTFAGALFAIVHLPNPILVPATFLWGAVSTYVFERTRSVFAVGIAQFLLSSILFLLTPVAWNHGFRVGPRYFYYH